MTKNDILEYFKDINYVYNNSNQLDTLSSMIDELLKEQEPRVLTLEEALLDDNGLEISPYVFVEIKDREDIFIGSVHDDIYGGYHSGDIKICVYRIWMHDSRTYPKTDYMRKIRFWSHKPTEEQRKAVKWDE